MTRTQTRRGLFVSICALAVVLPVAARAANPAGPEFLVNTTTAQDQFTTYSTRAVAIDDSGDFVVVWSEFQTSSLPDVYARRYERGGTPKGDEFVVNTSTDRMHWRPSVATDAAGNFVVVWLGREDSSFRSGIFAQRFDSAGARVGGEVEVSPITQGDNGTPAVAMSPDGRYVITWASRSQDGSGWGIFAQRYDATGSPEGAELQVNLTSKGNQEYPAAAMDEKGSFAIAWASQDQDGDGAGVYVRRFDAAGVAVSGEIPVNETTAGTQTQPSIAMARDGRFTVAWLTLSATSTSISGRLFDDAAAAVTTEFQVSETTGADRAPSVARDPFGNSVFSWTTAKSLNVFMRAFGQTGAALSGEAPVSTLGSGFHYDPSIAIDTRGDFVVVWTRFLAAGNGMDVYGRRFALDRDFGDAPSSYATDLVSDGARHIVGGPYLGNLVDAEADGIPSAGTSDDQSPPPGGDDEDGVVFTSSLSAGGTATIDVIASDTSYLDAWVDFDGDGRFVEAGDQVFTSQPLVAGTNSLSFIVPSSAPSVLTYARFRVSSTGGLGSTGPAGDGEVEDYEQVILPGTDKQLTITVGGTEGGTGFMSVVAGTTYYSCDNLGPDPNTCSFAIPPGTPVTVHAVNNPDSIFTGFTGNPLCPSTPPPPGPVPVPVPGASCALVINDATAVGAHFLGPQPLTVTVAGTDGGVGFVSVVGGTYPFPNTSYCDNLGPGNPHTCTFLFQPGTAVTVHAVNNPDSIFTGFTGNPLCPSTPPPPGPVPVPGASCDLIINDDTALGAHFLGPQPLTITVAGTDGGVGFVSVVGGTYPFPNTSYCDNLGPGNPHTCTFLFQPGTAVTVHAVNNPDSIFTGFTGNPLCPSTPPPPGPGPVPGASCALVINDATAVGAHFLGPQPLTVTVAGTEGGVGFVSVVGGTYPFPNTSYCDNLGPGNPHTCTFLFQPGTAVTVYAVNNPDSIFTGFTGNPLCPSTPPPPGPVPGPGASCALIIDNATAVGAHFLGPRLLAVTVNGTDAGVGFISASVFGNPPSAFCDNSSANPNTCSSSYPPGTVVTLSAAPGPDSLFTRWGGDCTGAGTMPTCTLTMSAHATVGAAFERPRDWGDAPAPYPTLLADDGARHGATSLLLGAVRDSEPDGQPETGATGDDTAVSPLPDDEDGVVFTSSLSAGGTASIEVTASTGGVLDAWVDFDGDGNWSGLDERVFDGVIVATGVNTLTFAVPADAAAGTTYARFRLSSAGVTSFTGAAPDGEVEDHQVVIVNATTYQLTVSVGGIEGGKGIVFVQAGSTSYSCDNIAPNPDHHVCQFFFPPDTEVTVSALANSDSRFEGFGGACSGTLPCPLVITADTDVFSAFLGPQPLNISVGGVEGGKGIVFVQAGSTSYSCDNIAPNPDHHVCQFFFQPDTEVTVSALANPDSRFEGFGGACSGTLPCPLVITADTDVFSAFLGPQPLNISVGGVEGGKGIIFVQAGSASYSCDNVAPNPDHHVCQFFFQPDTAVTVSALANPDSRFEGFGGACSGTLPCPLVITADTDVFSAFLGPQPLNISVGGVEGGKGIVFVQAGSASYSCDNVAPNPDHHVCQFFFQPDTAVTVSALANPDSRFEGFGGACSGTLPCPLVITADTDVFSAFLGPRLLGVTVDGAGGGTGSVQASPPATSCDNLTTNPNQCTFSYQPDTPVTLTAAGTADSVFTGWGGACAGAGTTPTCTLLMSAHATVTAGFTRLDFGDAPASYPTLLADDGARHVSTSLLLGSARDSEADGQPAAGANGDDAAGTDDEDGVVFTSPLSPGSPATLQVTASNGGILDAWVDFDADGTWSGPGEKVFDGLTIATGVNNLSFVVPSGAAGGLTYARFRLSSAGVDSFAGAAPDGEVEDYAVQIQSVLAVSDLTVTESDTATAAVFTVTLTPPTAAAVQVAYATANGTATQPADYTRRTGTLTFAPGVSTQTVSVPVVGDLRDEDDEQFVLNLSSPTGAAVADGQGVATILDDDATPGLSVGDVYVTEGDSGTISAVFTVSLSAASGRPVRVLYASAPGTALANLDYTPRTGTLSFAAGTLSRTVAVPVKGDFLDEEDETFSFELSGPTSATIADASGVATIADNDPEPSLSIGDAAILEGHSGIRALAFTAALSRASGRVVTVDYATADGTATAAGGDYAPAAGSLSFSPGQLTATVTVAVNGDTVDEADETLSLSLAGAANAVLADAVGQGTIGNDDDPPPDASITDVTITEGHSGTRAATFTVTLAAPVVVPVTVDFATANGTAVASGDYTARTGRLTFPAGTVSLPLTVNVVGDTRNETDESFFVNFTAASGAVIADGQGIGTIVNDDPVPSLGVGDATPILEGNTGTRTVSFTVTLSAASGQTVTVAYATANGPAGSGATAPGDYVAKTGSLTFSAGQVTKTVTVSVRGDLTAEDDETFFLDLVTPINATLGDGRGQATILDDEP